MSHRHRISGQGRDEHQGRPDPMYRPRRPSAVFGGARQRDVQDYRDQERAPDEVQGRYDRTGQEGYAHGLERFEQVPRRSTPDAPRWELDNGGVEFGRYA